MPIFEESSLSELLLKDVSLRLIEPHIHSVVQPGENTNSFDKAARFYDVVICNPLYNRLMWGYSVKKYRSLTNQAMTSSKGWVLDVGCGSLAFTAGTYIEHPGRPLVLLDQSLELLRIAKARLIKLNGVIPGNMIFIQGDALNLPFLPKSFNTIISLNLLHVLADLNKALLGLKNLLAEKGTMFFTTLIKNERYADQYLEVMLKMASGVMPRDKNQLRSIFNELGMYIIENIEGNMAFVCHQG